MKRFAPVVILAAALPGCAALASLFTASAPAIGQGLAAYEQAVEAARVGGPLPVLPASDPAVLAALCAARTVAAVQADAPALPPAPAPADLTAFVAATDRIVVALGAWTAAVQAVPVARRRRAVAALPDAGAVDAAPGDASAEGGT